MNQNYDYTLCIANYNTSLWTDVPSGECICNYTAVGRNCIAIWWMVV